MKKLIRKCFYLIIILLGLLVFNGCDESQSSELQDIFNLAIENGYTGTYEDWLNSIKGENGKDGHTPYVGENGNWWVDTTDTNVKAEGKDGLTPFIGENGNWWIGDNDTNVQAIGSNGLSAYEIYLKNHPEYNKSEEEWLDDLINGKLATNIQKSIEVDCEKTIYVGYKLKINAKVYPSTINQDVTYIVDEKYSDVASISEDGVVTANKPGSFIFKVCLKDDLNVSSGWKQIIIKNLPTPYEVGDLKGYEIKIMNAEYALADIDPFLDGYNASDKSYKQKAWKEVETAYNCTISVIPYEYNSWLTTYFKWLSDNAATGLCQTDLAIVSSNFIPELVSSKAAVDVSEMYEEYGLSQMDPILKAAGSYKGKLYVASTGISPTQTYTDLGLYYNYGLLEEIGAENPAKLFNEGKWTYSKFKEWVIDTQAKLGKNQYVLQGSPYYYWFGMTNAAGIQVVNPDTATATLYSNASKEASSLIYELVQEGCVNAKQTWAEGDDIEHSFHDGDTLMTTGYLWFVRNYGRWKSTLWGENTQFGYVPFPYPDNMSKEDTRVSQSGLSVYMYVSGRTYPEALGKNGYEKVWTVMNEMFLNTIKYQEEDSTFDAEKTKEESLKSKLDDPESVKAAMYFTADKVFFDPAHSIYLSTSETPLRYAANNVMYSGDNYEEEFERAAEKFEEDLKNKYEISAN